jgi:hypothetical protein
MGLLELVNYSGLHTVAVTTSSQVLLGPCFRINVLANFN